MFELQIQYINTLISVLRNRATEDVWRNLGYAIKQMQLNLRNLIFAEYSSDGMIHNVLLEIVQMFRIHLHIDR